MLEIAAGYCPVVWIIVTTRNSGETLDQCLLSVVTQTYHIDDRIEIIVVDNYSTDDTREIAQKFNSRILLAGPERTAQVIRVRDFKR